MHVFVFNPSIKGNGMPNYRRTFIPGATWFFTVNLLERYGNSLLTDKIDLLKTCIKQVYRKYPFHIDAWVVLPEHMHCVWTLPNGDADYPTRWRLIKSHFSRQLPLTERRSATRITNGEWGIWQRHYWEHMIRDEMDYRRHVDYLPVNPMKHGLVNRAIDWPHSTFHRYVEQGTYPADWCGDVTEIVGGDA